MQYLAIKSRAELVLQQAVERMHEVRRCGRRALLLRNRLHPARAACCPAG